MNRNLCLVCSLCLAAGSWLGCGTTASHHQTEEPESQPATQEAPPPSVAACEPLISGANAFERENVEGVFVIRAEATGCLQSTDPTLAKTPFLPQSTFKIAHTLIGLETGVIEGAEQRWLWDGSPRALSAWEQDMDLGMALQFSCVPCFQQVARRVGEERMRDYLERFNYGNHDIGGGIDQFWLTGSLRISPVEQADFVHRMISGDLAVDPENAALVWTLLELDRADSHVLYGKSGLGRDGGRVAGWFVGYVERDSERWTYATFMRSREGTDFEEAHRRIIPLRLQITRELLAERGVMPAGQ